MVVASLFIIHHVVCGECVYVSETGPGPLPAHYSLAVLSMCVRKWAVCSGLTDCFSVVGTLITAPTLSEASASLPPSFSLPATRPSRLKACPALVWHGARRERKIGKRIKRQNIKLEGEHKFGNRDGSNIWACSSCQLQQALGGKADLWSGSDFSHLWTEIGL